jgi:hypothetical protein
MQGSKHTVTTESFFYAAVLIKVAKRVYNIGTSVKFIK